MADIHDDWYRQITAQNGAHVALIQILFGLLLRGMTRSEGGRLADVLKAQSRDASHIKDAFIGDEVRSERLADIAIQMQEHIASVLDAAVANLPE